MMDRDSLTVITEGNESLENSLAVYDSSTVGLHSNLF
jgi:hypothetical protein